MQVIARAFPDGILITNESYQQPHKVLRRTPASMYQASLFEWLHAISGQQLFALNKYLADPGTIGLEEFIKAQQFDTERVSFFSSLPAK
jgi:hypothetical protein